MVIFSKCLKKVKKLLSDERALLDKFAAELLQKEELEYDEIEEIFKTHVPEDRRTAKKKYTAASEPSS